VRSQKWHESSDKGAEELAQIEERKEKGEERRENIGDEYEQ
jgi:hypothetical protein